MLDSRCQRCTSFVAGPTVVGLTGRNCFVAGDHGHPIPVGFPCIAVSGPPNPEFDPGHFIQPSRRAWVPAQGTRQLAGGESGIASGCAPDSDRAGKLPHQGFEVGGHFGSGRALNHDSEGEACEPGVCHTVNTGEVTRFRFAREILRHRQAGLPAGMVHPCTCVGIPTSTAARKPGCCAPENQTTRSVVAGGMRSWQDALGAHLRAREEACAGGSRSRAARCLRISRSAGLRRFFPAGSISEGGCPPTD